VVEVGRGRLIKSGEKRKRADNRTEEEFLEGWDMMLKGYRSRVFFLSLI